MPSERLPRPAYVVDVDENGKTVRGTVRSALKEKPKVSQHEGRSSRTKKPNSDSGDKSSSYSQAVEHITAAELKLERRKSVGGNPKSPRKSTRPPLTQENRTNTKLLMPQRSPRDVPSNYGIPSPVIYTTPAVSTHAPVQIPLRPRAVTTQTYPLRPLSHHQAYTSTGAHGPPLSMSAFYPHSQIITPSYPPPSPNSSYMRYADTPSNPQIDYFQQHIAQAPPRPLSARFDVIPRSQALDPITRTASAFGTRETRRPSIDGYDEAYYEDSYASRVSDPVVRRRETIRAPMMRPVEDLDAIAMPPPPRPSSILRRPVTEFSIEPLDTRTHYSDRYERADRQERPQYREAPRPRRPSAHRHSASYDHHGRDSERVRIETANNGRQRRQSYYEQTTTTAAAPSVGYEDKVNQASTYQEEVGGKSLPLTADMLRKQQRRQGGSSRSTKSSGSRDESDYRKSATTRTTRSGSGNDDENVTIKVTGHARVVVGGAQIDCNDGGEISISRQKSLHGGSERGSEYGALRQIDDRRSRIDGPIGRSRMSSTHSYIRSTPEYPMDNYF